MPVQETVKLRYLRMAPRKVRAVAGAIRGLSVNEAEAQLLLQPRRAAKPLLKLLRSAAANIRNNRKMDERAFMIEMVRVDGGPMLKRALPRARGVASPIQRKMSHVTMTLAESGRSARFEIVRSKKAKTPKPERRRAPRASAKPDGAAEPQGKQEKGFFRRMFNRKAMGGS